MFIRDQSTGALINTDNQQYNVVVNARKKQKEIEGLNNRMCRLETQVAEIKQILQRLVEK